MSEPLARAHLSALKQQMPLLYLIVTINSAVLAVMHLGIAPACVVVLPFAVLASVAIARAIFWWRLDPEAIPRERQLPMLRAMNRLTGVLGLAILAWALAMEHYDPASSDMHILSFLALTSLGCIFCLTHLRSAALIVAATVIGPTVVIALQAREADLTAVAINLLLVGLVILRILNIQHRDFVERVSQHVSLRELGDQNLRLATTDMLTGLANRRTFFPALEAMIDRHADGGPGFIVAIVDLHGFKHINDTFGHVIGDRVLAAVADRLAAALPCHVLLARIGGDEFAMLALEDGPPRICDYVEAATHAAFDDLIRCGELEIRVGGALGLAWWSPGQGATDVIERADYAMYQGKSQGGNAIVLFNDGHELVMRSKWAVETALRHADLDAELSLVFQPIVDVDHQRTIAFEALARWDNPELGRVPPDQFITAAERVGVISDITKALFGKLLGTMRDRPLPAVSFNLSPADVISAEAVSTLIAMVATSQVDPSRLHFEVTETAMLTDFVRAHDNLERLRAMGSRVSLDDFGTGHSTLSHVHRLPVDKLKVDASFTREILTHETARNIIASIIGLAHGLRLDCIVEGVETMEQVLLLRGLGCRIMQGYLFHKPMAEGDLDDYLRAENFGAEDLAKQQAVA